MKQPHVTLKNLNVVSLNSFPKGTKTYILLV